MTNRLAHKRIIQAHIKALKPIQLFMAKHALRNGEIYKTRLCSLLPQDLDFVVKVMQDRKYCQIPLYTDNIIQYKK